MLNSDSNFMLQISSLALPYALILASPGPNLLVILRVSLASSMPRTLAAALGIACGATLAAAIAFQGSLLFIRADQLEVPFGIVFAAMLAWSSVRLMQKGRRADVTASGSTAPRLSKAFGLGVIASLSNPLTIPFFLSFFVANAASQSSAAIASLIVFVMAATWFSLVGVTSRYLAVSSIDQRISRLMHVVLSIAMMGYALHILANIIVDLT